MSISGVIDFKTPNEIIEVKTTSTMSISHIIQVIFYMYIWNKENEDEEILNGYVYYTLLGKCIKINYDREIFKEIFEDFVNLKLFNGNSKNRKEFFEYLER